MMSFAAALQLLKQGACVSRDAWGDKYIYLGRDKAIYMVGPTSICIWCDTQEDLLAEDWYTIKNTRCSF